MIIKQDFWIKNKAWIKNKTFEEVFKHTEKISNF